MDIVRSGFLVCFICSIFSYNGFGTDVLTYHNDNARTGWNPNEVALTPANVNAASFGLLFNLPVDGKVDAQPLYVSGTQVANSSGLHNLVIVATENDSVYAFDADTGTLYWQTDLLASSGEVPSDDRGCGQVTPEIGVTATPVIDRTSGISGTNGTIYLVAMSKSTGTYHQRLHALNLVTGQEARSPVEIQASYPGTGPDNNGGDVIFDPGAYKERSALLLLNGIVYTTWASHCDNPPYTSWIIGYNENSLAQTTVLNLDPNGAPNSPLGGSGNAFWNSGAGPAADGNGYIYDLTANGPFETTLLNGFPSGGDYGDTFLKLSSQSGLAVSDYFTPFDQANDAAEDIDFGSGGVVVLPDMVDSSNNIRHLAIGAGKDSNIYLVDRDNMGKFNPGATSNTNIYQELPGALPGGEWATAAYFNSAVYYGPVGGALQRFTFTGARLNPLPAAMTQTVFAYPGVTPSISSSGNSSGIVWAYENSNSANQAVLHAYDATSLVELYSSDQDPQRDQFGQANKFITPTICNGKVFVATTNSVGVFGLFSSTSLPILTNFIGYSGDFYGDGKQDILWRNTQTGEVRIWHMNGTTLLSDDYVATVGLDWIVAGIGDFNGDGISDILWENTVNGGIAIWIMRGNNLVYEYQQPSPGLQWSITGVADLDHTGLADILWRNVETGEVRIWRSVSPLAFSSLSLGFAGLDWNLIGTADLFGNGFPELIWRNQSSGEVRAWELSGDSLIANVSLAVIPLNWQIVAFGDFNGDGRQDILWRNDADGSVVIWIMDGFGADAQWFLGAVSLDWQIRAVPNVFGTSVSSVLWSNTTTGQQVIWGTNGASFSGSAQIGVADPTWLVQPAAADQ